MMTTKVTVDAHAGWDVKVTISDTYPPDAPLVSEVIVLKFTTQDFYITSCRTIQVEEVQP